MRPADGAVAVELDGRWSLLAPHRTDLLLLDDAGSLVWDLLRHGTTWDALLDDLASATGAARPVLAEQAGVLVQRLREDGALA